MYDDYEPPPPPSRFETARRQGKEVGAWAGDVIVKLLFYAVLLAVIASFLGQK